MAFTSVESLLRAAADMPLWQAVRDDDMQDRGADAAESWDQMARLWTAMSSSITGTAHSTATPLYASSNGCCPADSTDILCTICKIHSYSPDSASL